MFDIARDHQVAWRLGAIHFHYQGAESTPSPRGMLIGEAPGPNTKPQLPLYPQPSASAAGRLLRYAGVDPVDYIGRLVRMNLCREQWSTREATGGVVRALAYLLDEKNFYDGKPLRVLLLGRRVADAWRCGPAAFGHEIRHYTGGGVPNVHVAWIPHPSGRNLFYNHRHNQLRARRAVLWALGMRDKP